MRERIVMRYGLKYRLKRPYDDEKPDYDWVIPMEYADGCEIGDCLLVNSKGFRHPGYNNSAIVINAKNINFETAKPARDYDEG